MLDAIHHFAQHVTVDRPIPIEVQSSGDSAHRLVEPL
jgi:hypothetical protein